jgi:MFS family permease
MSTPEGFLAAFHFRNYRYLWSSVVAMAAAFSIEMVVIGWLVLELTDSPTMVGLVAASRFAGMGLGPFLGALADRFDRKNILILARAASSAFGFILAALYFTSALEVWHVFVLVLFGGLVRVFGMITNQAVLPDTVGGPNLASAVGMQMVGMNTMFMVGPLVGGYLYELIGAGGCFAVISTAHLLSSVLVLPLQVTTTREKEQQESLWNGLVSGIRYTRHDQALFSLMILSAAANFFAWPCVVSIMPVFARDVLQVGASELGWLLSAEGLGGLVGALAIAPLGKFRHKGWLPIIALVLWSALLVAFASSRLIPLSLSLLVGVGICRSITFAIFHVLILSWAAEDVRARVMGIYTFSIGTSPVGSIFLGFGADLWNASIIITVSALACALFTVVITLMAPELHRRQ